MILIPSELNMRKFLKKTLCVVAAAVMGASLFTATACSEVYKSTALKGDISGEVVSNGGFAVQKGNYIYYINGKQSNTANNTFGKVETGAIMRVSLDDLKKRNYANTETVVPEIAHSGNSNAGIFIYGNYVYYTTPSAEKSSNGQIQSSTILFKRAKLDGTEVMKGYYAKYSNNAIEYRYVLGDDNVVYLLYVATSEDLYGTACTNIHSVNTVTGVDTLLAYNVGTVTFDKADLTNPRIYYTMTVTDFALDGKDYSSKYNQVYTVTADTTERNEYDFTDVDDYDAKTNPLYINCGTLVLDGIGKIDANLGLTQFNAKELSDKDKLESHTRESYKYTLSEYENGILFYTRTSTNNSTAKLFAVNESVLLDKNHEPAIKNPEDFLLMDGSNSSSYTYVFDEVEGKKVVTGAFIANSNGIIRTVVDENGLLAGVNEKDIDNAETFYLTNDGTPSILFTKGDYVYYSESGNSGGNIIKRVDYTGAYDDYTKYPFDEEDGKQYLPVRVLDLVWTSGWYNPEMFGGYILFSTETTTMTEYSSGTADYSHIMVCDVSGSGEDGTMTNGELEALNELYEGIDEKFEEVDGEKYANLQDAYHYAFYTGDLEYIEKVRQAYINLGGDEDEFWSQETVDKFKEYFSEEGDWKDYVDEAHTKAVNGKSVHANQRDYYYSLLGKMTSAQAKEYDEYLKNKFLKSWPETDETWFESLSAGAKAGFLIGVIGGGLLVIAAGVVVTLVVIRKRKSKMPTYTKKRIKVDTTDDKSVDVYANEDAENKTEE